MKLSLVVSMYNVEAFIEKCLLSCLSQDSVPKETYEVLVINDGSTDHSLEIAERIASRNECIRVISKDNGGLSSARNVGIHNAKGEYIWFIDSDDWIAASSVSCVLPLMQNSPDVIPVRAQTIGESRIRNKIKGCAISGKDVLLSSGWEHCSPFYIVRKQFLIDNNLSFFEGIYHEDSEFTPRMLYYAQTVSVSENVLYFVFKNPNSITRSKIAKKSYDNLFVANRLNVFAADNVVDYQIDRVYKKICSVLINNALANIITFDESEKKAFNGFLYKNSSILFSLKSSALKYRIEYVLFKVFKPNYTGVYSFLRLFR